MGRTRIWAPIEHDQAFQPIRVPTYCRSILLHGARNLLREGRPAPNGGYRRDRYMLFDYYGGQSTCGGRLSPRQYFRRDGTNRLSGRRSAASRAEVWAELLGVSFGSSGGETGVEDVKGEEF